MTIQSAPRWTAHDQATGKGESIQIAFDEVREDQARAFRTEVVGPIVYNQDNSGVNTDTTTPIEYRPEQFGAPAGARIIPGTVAQGYTVFRGLAYVQDVRITATNITFDVYTQAAGGGIFGHHSGSIAVSTSFQWFVEE